LLVELFGEVFVFCVEVGLVCVGVIVVDGMKLYVNVLECVTCSYEDIVCEIFDDVVVVDVEEDECFGDVCGDELLFELVIG